jgi:5-methylcytosine-specific restriction endonuclease McrA
VSIAEHPDCQDCGAPSVGETPHGPMCEACAEKRQRAARARVVWCTNRIGNCCTGKATADFDTEPSCEGCRRHLTRLRTPAKRPGGSRGAPQRIRNRVLARDGYQCQLRYPNVCTVEATEVDHVVNVATVLARGGTRQQADDPSNCVATCAKCHSIKSERERVAGIRSRTATRTKRLRLPAQRHPGEW